MIAWTLRAFYTAREHFRREAHVARSMVRFRFERPDIPDGICDWGRPYEDHDHEEECTHGHPMSGWTVIDVLDPDDEDDD